MPPEPQFLCPGTSFQITSLQGSGRLHCFSAAIEQQTGGNYFQANDFLKLKKLHINKRCNLWWRFLQPTRRERKKAIGVSSIIKALPQFYRIVIHKFDWSSLKLRGTFVFVCNQPRCACLSSFCTNSFFLYQDCSSPFSPKSFS